MNEILFPNSYLENPVDSNSSRSSLVSGDANRAQKSLSCENTHCSPKKVLKQIRKSERGIKRYQSKSTENVCYIFYSLSHFSVRLNSTKVHHHLVVHKPRKCKPSKLSMSYRGHRMGSHYGGNPPEQHMIVQTTSNPAPV